jgi:hypothetical protein
MGVLLIARELMGGLLLGRGTRVEVIGGVGRGLLVGRYVAR